MRRNLILKLAVIAAVGMFALPEEAGATTIYTANLVNGQRMATASFDQTGSTLTLTLTNTSTFDVVDPAYILTGFLWDFTTPVTLTATGAAKTAASLFVYTSNGLTGTQANNDVSGEWAYKYSNNFAYGTYDYGVGTAGFSPANLFGNGDLIGSTDRNGKTGPGGVDFGLVPVADNLATGNGGVTGSVLIQSAINITWTLAPGVTLNQSSFSSFAFLYGTASSDAWNPTLPPNEVPEPATFALVGAASLVAFLKLRKRK